MKIAYVVHDLSKKRGHDKYVFEHIENLRDRHIIHVFSSSIEDVPINNFIFHKIPVIRFSRLLKSLSFIVTSLPIVWIAFKKEKFDIIHYQGACSIPIGPAIITAHVCSAELLKIYRRVAHYDFFLKRIYHALYAFISASIEKIFFNNNSVLKIISPSELARRQLVQNYDIPPDKIKTIYEGVNVEEIDKDKARKISLSLKQSLGIGQRDFVILFIGDYLIKGLDVVAKAIEHLKCKIIILGSGNRDYFTKLSDMSEKAIFMGWQPDILKYFTMSDAFLCPTRCDSFNLSALEAMANELPCIISRRAGISELLLDKNNVILLDYPFNHAQIKESIELLISDSSLRKRIAKEGKEFALKHTWEKVVRETEGLYENLHTCKWQKK